MLEVRPGSQRVLELDGLRGFAILVVLLDHYLGSYENTDFSHYWLIFFRGFSVGRVGVDLFFVLSGFLIGGILLESRDSANYFRTFYLRRVHRILPVYYSWILLYLIGLGILHFFAPAVSLTSADSSNAFRYFPFLQNFFPHKTHLEWVWLGVTWSLAIEEQFYLFAPLVVRYVPVRRLPALLVAVVLLAPVLRLLVLLGPVDYHYIAASSTPCRADALALGMLAALAWRSERFHRFLRKNPSFLRRVLLFFFVAVELVMRWMFKPLGVFVGTVGYSTLALFFLALLLFVLACRESWLAGFMRLGPLRELGTVSYCVYIIHVPVLYVIHRVLLHSTPRIDSLLRAAVTLLATLVTLGIAALSWHFMEKPLIKRGHRFVYTSAETPSS